MHKIKKIEQGIKIEVQPVIGISGGTAVTSDYYIQAVVNAGGIPIVIPMTESKEAIRAQLSMVDALIVADSGPEEINPILYGEELMEKLGSISPKRDRFDYMLLKGADEKNLPVLGINRGMQIINTYYGGTLYQDISYIGDTTIKHDQSKTQRVTGNNQIEEVFYPTHKVSIADDSILNELFETDELWVNSFHSTAVKDVAPDFRIAAVATDGVIESIELEMDEESERFIVGYQWNVEMLAAKKNKDALTIFKKFFDVVKEKNTKTAVK